MVIIICTKYNFETYFGIGSAIAIEHLRKANKSNYIILTMLARSHNIMQNINLFKSQCTVL